MVLARSITTCALMVALPSRSAPSSLAGAMACADSAAAHEFFVRYRKELPPNLMLNRGALVIVCGDRITFAEGFGRTAAGDSVDPARTIFRAASNSKLIAATAVMQLADRGLWALDDDVNRYLPPAARLTPLPRAGPVTLANLLTHTAGFEDKFAGGVVVPADRLTLTDFFRLHSPRRVVAPASEVSYSNIGMALAGYLVEARTGKPFARYAEREIFAPLGMTRSTFDQPPPREWTRDLAGGPPRGRYDVVFNPYPAASLVATPVDMGHFIAAHLTTNSALGTGRVLSPDAMEEMHATHWRAQPAAPGVAYGFFEGSLNGRRTLFHTGDSGDHSLVLILPDERVGLYFVFSGADEQAPARDRFARVFMNTFFPTHGTDALAPTTDAGTIPEPSTSALAGTYRSASYSRSNYEKIRALFAQVTIRPGERGSLLLTPPGPTSPVRLERTSRLTFRRDSGEVVAYRQAPDGRVIGFTLGGLIWDPSSWDKIPWWENGRMHLAAVAIALLALALRLLWTPVAWIVRRIRRRDALNLTPDDRRVWRCPVSLRQRSVSRLSSVPQRHCCRSRTRSSPFREPLRCLPRYGLSLSLRG